MKPQPIVLLALGVAQPASAAVPGKSTLTEIDRTFADWQFHRGDQIDLGDGGHI